jgi:hypothetical protein
MTISTAQECDKISNLRMAEDVFEIFKFMNPEIPV